MTDSTAGSESARRDTPPSPSGPAGKAVSGTTRLGALDGLRGLALIGMLAWHAEVGWVRGGFARMTIFFVLAGYLAAGSLRRSSDAGHARPFAVFWSRRARRLLPVTLLGVAWAVLVTALVGSPTSRAGLTGDAAATLGSVANWRFILEDRAYGALFESGTAFEHYWSLSLEEQSFLVLPLLVAVAARIARGRRGAATARVLVGIGVLAGLSPAFFAQAPDTVYYGTHTRIGEFLIGVALAEALASSPATTWTKGRTSGVALAGASGLIALVATMLFVDRDQAWLYEGGLILFAFPAAAVVAAATAGGRFVTTTLAVAPLRALGRWALPVYVVHWPLYQLMDDGRVGLEGSSLVVAQLTLSILVGWVVHRLVEQPLMQSPVWGPRAARQPGAAWRPLGALAATSVLLVATTGLVPRTEPLIDFESAAAETGSIDAEQAAAIVSDPRLSHEEATELFVSMGGEVPFVLRDHELVGVGLYGGSSAMMLGMGETPWAEPLGLQSVPGYAGLGCGLVVQGERRNDDSAVRSHQGRPPEPCSSWELRWPATAVIFGVDVAVVVPSTWDLDSFMLDGGSGSWTHLGEPEADEHMRQLLELVVGGFEEVGTSRVVFLTMPPPASGVSEGEAARHRERAAVYDSMIREVAERDEDVVVLDYGAWLDSLDAERLDEVLPDGVHATAESSTVIWEEFLAPGLAASARLESAAGHAHRLSG